MHNAQISAPIHDDIMSVSYPNYNNSGVQKTFATLVKTLKNAVNIVTFDIIGLTPSPLWK